MDDAYLGGERPGRPGRGAAGKTPFVAAVETTDDGNAPRNVFTILCFVLKILKSVSPSPTRAIERFQDDQNRAIRLFAGFY
jgi:hypothetical protein